MSDSSEIIVGKIAHSFAQALVAGDFLAAHKFLSDPLRTKWSPSQLKEELNRMIEYGDGPPDQVELITFDNMNDWPSRQAIDIGWAYVAICGDGFNEAVSVIVASEDQQIFIRDLEWGRP